MLTPSLRSPSLHRGFVRRLAATSLGLAILAATSVAQETNRAAAPAAPAAAVATAAVAPHTVPERTFINHFLPTPIIGKLVSEIWGAPGVFPRDPKNGLEDPTNKQFSYWDGQIIKGKDGKYHMFSSRWDQALGHNGWRNSLAVHTVSDNVFGPYEDKGLMWPDDMGGKGHNVTALVLPNDEGYAVIVSETRPAPVAYVSKSLDGPWELKGTLQGVQNSNISIMVRPDGDFQIVPRNGNVYLSKKADGILGPYKNMTNGTVFPRGPQYPNMEDPCVFFAGGLYHIVVNSWSTRKAYHLTSQDGITNWVNHGLAYDPRKDFVRYTDGTVNNWDKMERFGVLVENGAVTAVSLSVLDVEKNQERGNDTHGSKIVVIPFEGTRLNRDMDKYYASAAAAAAVPPAAAPAAK
ncbi:MAG: glycoside hydrolase family protein [Opitutaceae bacterium]